MVIATSIVIEDFDDLKKFCDLKNLVFLINIIPISIILVPRNECLKDFSRALKNVYPKRGS